LKSKPNADTNSCGMSHHIKTFQWTPFCDLLRKYILLKKTVLHCSTPSWQSAISCHNWKSRLTQNISIDSIIGNIEPSRIFPWTTMVNSLCYTVVHKALFNQFTILSNHNWRRGGGGGREGGRALNSDCPLCNMIQKTNNLLCWK